MGNKLFHYHLNIQFKIKNKTDLMCSKKVILTIWITVNHDLNDLCIQSIITLFGHRTFYNMKSENLKNSKIL